MKITKRDVKFFLLGLLAMLVIETIYDWEGTKQAFKDGWAHGMSRAK
ncbi:MAG: hypothetical protein RIG68_24075 [Imperialibacter sp.]